MFAWQELFIYIDKIFPFDLKEKYIGKLEIAKRKSFFLEKKYSKQGERRKKRISLSIITEYIYNLCTLSNT